MSQSKYIQELQHLRHKYKEQSAYMDQVLAQLTVSFFEIFFFVYFLYKREEKGIDFVILI